MSAFIAIGAATRIVLGTLALEMPTQIFSILIKVGLTETLTFINGFVFGPGVGFLTGALIIIISDIGMTPGPWTPFIAAIIGLFGVGAGLIRRYVNPTSSLTLGLCAALLTIMSEFLQNSWVALFYGTPILAAMILGLPSAVTALVNNVILIVTVGPRAITLVQKAILRPSPTS
jgi:uncharacterized membrane protein